MAENFRNDLPFSTDIPAYQTTEPNHASVLNRRGEQLVSNDAYLKAEQDDLKRKIQEGLPAKGGNADTVDDCHAGTESGNVLKLGSDGKAPEKVLINSVRLWWRPSTTYQTGEAIQPLEGSKNFIYSAKTGGVTSTTKPSFPTVHGQTVQDGQVTWEAIDLRNASTIDGHAAGQGASNVLVLDAGAKVPLGVLSFIQNNRILEAFLNGAAKRWWKPNTSYAVGNVVEPLGALNGQFYECIQAGTTSSSEPAWPTSNGSEFTDGTVRWRTKPLESFGGYVGKIEFPTYIVQENHLKLNGALLLRASYPKLWEFAQNNSLVVTEATWQAVDETTGLQLKSGLFSSGDGSTTFRLPDHRGMFYRVLDEGCGIDSESSRVLGSSQGDAIRDITGSMTVYTALSHGNLGDGAFSVENGGGLGESYQYAGTRPRFVFKASNVVPTATENRVRNVGLFATIQYK